MILKPKKTTGEPKALLYRRYIGLERSENLQTIYKTIEDNKYWLYDSVKKEFSEINASEVPQTSEIQQVQSGVSVLKYQNILYKYINFAWQVVESTDVQPLSLKFNNVAKYQVNKYYFVGSFDFTSTGGVESTTTQYLKGNIMPLVSFDIKHYNDYVNLQPDDLVVIKGHLYSVENPSWDHKHMPKDFYVYYATLNSIL